MRTIAAILVAFVLALGAAPAQAAKRVALVLGNAAYAHAPALANPRRDAEAMAAALERLGFEVELGVDLDLAGMRRAVLAYARKLDGAEVALFFYAGHGMQVFGQNYLLPVDADVSSEVDLDFAAMPARLVLAQMERWPATKIVILDACRDNPFATALSRSMGKTRATQALSRGLAQIEAAGGTLLAYATDPGDVAADGQGDNSPFTDALLAHVETPGVEIHTMLARVRADVYTATGQRQRPWTESSLIGEFYLAPEPEVPPVTSAMLAPQTSPDPAPPSSALDPREIELAVWQAAQAGGTAEDYAEYLRQYPDGIFAGLARNRLAALARTETAPEGGTGAPQAQAALPEPVLPEPATPAPGTAPGAAGQPSPATRPDEGPAGADVAEPPPPDTGGTPDAPHTAGSEGLTPSARPGADEAPDPALAAAAAEEKLALSRDRRREVQARLLVAGHDPRGVDGIFGPGTRTALRDWQAAQGVTSTGYLDTAALELLERVTATAYAAWVEQQRFEEAARRAAAERAQAERQAARTVDRPERTRTAPAQVPEVAPARAAPEATAAEAPALATPAPQPERRNPLATPPRGGAARDRYEQECYFVTTGVADLKRICN